MKITYLANIRLPTEKAHGIQITKMCEAFATLGNEVTLIVPDRSSPIAEGVFSYYGIRENFMVTRLATYNPTTITRFTFTFQSYLFFLQSFFVTLLQRNGLVYSRETIPLLLLALFRRTLIWEAHTKKGPVVTRFLARHCVCVVAISSGLKEALVAAGIPEEKIIVAHDAIDPNDFPAQGDKGELRRSLGLPIDRKIVGYVGKYRTAGLPKGVDGGKGVDELMDAFVVVRERIPDALLLVVGLNPEDMVIVHARAALLGIPESARVLIGHVPHSRALSYMSAADILVMNYPNIEHYAHFMSPLKLFEYMGSGVAIVTSDLPVVREVLDETCAVLVSPGDTPALAEGISMLLADKEKSATLASSAASRVRSRYTWLGRARGILDALVSEEKHRHNQ
jgi:glycosyltransferase involved in cell wall biosynthesis